MRIRQKSCLLDPMEITSIEMGLEPTTSVWKPFCNRRTTRYHCATQPNACMTGPRGAQQECSRCLLPVGSRVRRWRGRGGVVSTTLGAAPHAHAVSGYLRKLEHGPNTCPLELTSWAVQKRPSSGSICQVWPFEIFQSLTVGNSHWKFEYFWPHDLWFN